MPMIRRLLRAGLGWAVLLALAAPPALAQVRLALPNPLLAGERLPLPVPEEFWAPCALGLVRWAVQTGPGRIDAVSGDLVADPVEDAALVRIALVDRCGEALAEGLVLVLPQAPFALVAKVLGPGWLEAYSGALPFRDPETGARPQGAGPVDTAARLKPLPAPGLVAGYGLTVPMEVTAPGAGMRLGYREGDLVVRRDLPVEGILRVAFTGAVRGLSLESLTCAARNRWLSVVQDTPVVLRGLVPFAGNTLAGPGHRDGQGLSARFQAPGGLARVEVKDHGRMSCAWLVCDPSDHVLRLVTAGGLVRTLAGRPGQAGHRDSVAGCWFRLARGLGLEPPAAQFNRPTHVSADWADWANNRWAALVSDSSNHVIRRVQPDGSVSTLAGAPGQPGYKNALDLRQARFRDPQGLARSSRDWVYLADAGNRVLRAFHPRHGVTTVAGEPGAVGSADGLGRQARFTELGALVLGREDRAGFPEDQAFFIDGNALRKISLESGQVVTLAGRVETPGFRDTLEGGLESRRAALREPCLNRPAALAWAHPHLYIADRGNHSLRRLHLAELRLETVAGGPDRPETRWGLLELGLGVPPDRRFASLESPCGLALDDSGRSDTLIVATGSGLAEACTGEHAAAPLRLRECRCEPARPNEACLVHLRAEAPDASGQESARPFQYEVDFLDPDGSLAEHREGWARTGEAACVAGSFTQGGTGTVLVRCVTDRGSPAGARISVAIAESPG